MVDEVTRAQHTHRRLWAATPPATREHAQHIGYNARNEGTLHAIDPLPPIAMPLGIRPINDFAFKRTFVAAENRAALISLLNAILKPASPIVEVTLENPFNLQDYEPGALLELLPQPAIRQATETLARISQISEDKAMYDAREKAIRDRKWELNAAYRDGEREGKIEGKIELIRTLQGILSIPVSVEQDLRGITWEQLEALTSSLQERIRGRPSS